MRHVGFVAKWSSLYNCQNIGRSGTENGAKKGSFFSVVVGFKLSDQEGVRNVLEVIFKSQMFEASIFWVFRIFLRENAFFPRACFFFSQTFGFPSKRVGFKVFTIDTAHAKIFAVVVVCYARFEIIAIVFASTSNRFETWKIMFDRRCNFDINLPA